MHDLMTNSSIFFFNDTATTEIYTLSLHDALPISNWSSAATSRAWWATRRRRPRSRPCSARSTATRSPSSASWPEDRKSTRLNSSHANISYAVFCLKKKKQLYLALIPDDHIPQLLH